MKPRILFLVPSDYDDLTAKGVISMMGEREEQGFFERVITVHPAARQDRILDLSPVHRLYELKEYFLPLCENRKWLRYPHHIFHLFRAARRIINIVDEERINLIRATDPMLTGILAWWVTLFRPIPYCVSIHADLEKRYELDGTRGAQTILGSRRLARILERFVLRHATLVMPIRESLAQKVINEGIPPQHIGVIPHGIDLSLFVKDSGSIRQTLSIPQGVQIVSFVGRLSKENYVYDVIDLAEVLSKKRSDFVIVIAGDGVERANIEKLCQEKKLQNCMRVVGFQPRNVVVSLRKESNISLCLMGGFSLIEACAAGSPTIAYDVEWHSELIKTGETGLLVPEHDPAKLLEAATYLLDHAMEGKEMGARAKQLAFDRHDLQKTSLIKQTYYQRVLSDHSRNK